MNFEEALRHMQEGTASDEEKAYVESKLQEANKHVEDDGPRVIQNPKPAKIKGQKREIGKFFKLMIAIAVVFVALGTIFAGVFGSAAAAANKTDFINKAQAAATARDYVFDMTKNGMMGLPLVNKADDFIARDVDRDLKYNAAKPSASYYVYEVALYSMGIEIDVEVDSRTSACRIKDVDKD